MKQICFGKLILEFVVVAHIYLGVSENIHGRNYTSRYNCIWDREEQEEEEEETRKERIAGHRCIPNKEYQMNFVLSFTPNPTISTYALCEAVRV